MNTEQNQYPSTVPAIQFVEGKQYAGIIINATPYWGDPRCLCGDLVNDKKGRFKDMSPIRTSLVQKLHFEDSKVYALTLNSAYEISTMDLGSMLQNNFWLNIFSDLINDIKGV